jgi:Cdc6-like AAA superfamily ATPase
MKILLLGASGCFGTELKICCENQNIILVHQSSNELNITDYEKLEKKIISEKLNKFKGLTPQILNLIIDNTGLDRNKINNDEITSVEQAKKWIEQICLFLAYEEESDAYIIPQSFKDTLSESKLTMANILPYNGNPDRYERIASVTHKNQLYNSFKGLLTEEQRNDDSLNLDEKIYAIREVLGVLANDPNFDFYEKKYLKIWNYSLSEEGFDEVQGLQYKKAIILYGPPGTSKTYTAKSLSKALITNAFLKDKNNVAQYFREDKDITEGKIHHLQLHPNYTYEDFVIGYQLQNNQTEVTPGILFSICEAAEKDKGSTPNEDVPHVLILDEINRIDLSRLFGEVFSAIENREQPISLGVGNYKLTIPRNLYIIGTMNEIDFSLEQIDFALQRRFLWYFYGFDAAILKSIIDAADGELSRLKKSPSYVGRYYDSIADLLLNFCFLLTFWYITDISIIFMLIAFFGIQLQGTLYNYYYVILRNSVQGDSTSRVFENSKPKALKGESQSRVNLFFPLRLFRRS